jgi:hypothetical protein
MFLDSRKTRPKTSAPLPHCPTAPLAWLAPAAPPNNAPVSDTSTPISFKPPVISFTPPPIVHPKVGTGGGGGTDRVTGSGSYNVGGQTNATYQASVVGSFNVNDTENDQNETETGADAYGNPYTLNYNYTGQTQGSGNLTASFNYQATNAGISITNETLGNNGSSSNSYHFWGTLDGQAFDESESNPETWSDPSETFPGVPGPISNPNGLIGTFPFNDMAAKDGAVYTPPSPYPGNFLAGDIPQHLIDTGVQEFYNHAIYAASKDAVKKVANLATHRAVMDQIRLTSNAKGTFIFEGADGGGRGNTFAEAMGDTKELNKAQEQQLSNFNSKNSPFTGATMGKCDVELTYAVDGAANATRSGNLAITYRYLKTYNMTNKTTGQAVVKRVPVLGSKVTQFHDDNLENMSGLK